MDTGAVSNTGYGFTRLEPAISSVDRTILNATPDCIKVVSPEGTLITMNRAGCLALGIPLDSPFGMPWLPLLPESVHELGREALARASAGEAARFSGQSIAPDGTTNYWDNLLTPITNEQREVISVLCVSRDITQKTRLELELGEAVEREKLLAREMQHRIKNIFSIVLGLISVSEREFDNSTEGTSATRILREKIKTLSRASDAVFSKQEPSGPLGKVEIGSLIHSLLQPYQGLFHAAGEKVHTCQNNVTTIALLLHELATNSMKYGAFGNETGRVQITWTQHNDHLALTWSESGVPSKPEGPSKQGFGSELIQRIIQASGGQFSRTWNPDGLQVEMLLPNGHG